MVILGIRRLVEDHYSLHYPSLVTTFDAAMLACAAHEACLKYLASCHDPPPWESGADSVA